MLETLAINPPSFFVWIAALLVAVTIHEFSHALAADRLGDPTPRVQGRLTLNPLKHLDPLGTLMLILFRFGWGKPVQFDPYNLENPRRDAAIISFAGPASNLLLASAIALVVQASAQTGLQPMLTTTLALPFIYFNVILAVFNLLPIHPLDGGKVLIGLLPPDTASSWDRFLAQYGFMILIFLILPIFGGRAVLWSILGPTINIILNLLLPQPLVI